MKRLSRNEIEIGIEESVTMFETLEQLKANTDRQQQAEANRQHSWTSFEHPAALSDEQLRCLNLKARELGRPLTDEERAFLLGDKCPQPRVSGVRFLDV